MTTPPGHPIDPGTLPLSVCPRHTDREAYVRCQRCGRPACPECQRPAAVGIQCVDCVKEAARSMPTQRTVLGGVVSADPGVVTRVIIGVCVVAFVLQQAIPTFTADYAFSPVIGWREPWRFLTSGFLHYGVVHIALNMYCLWQIGPYLESLLGRARFVALYLLTAIGGSVGVLLLAAAPTTSDLSVLEDPAASWLTQSAGASGSVFGLFGALLVLNRHLGRSTAGIGVAIAANAVIGFIPSFHIAWQAHLGGLVTGVALAALVTTLRDPARRRWQWPAFAAVLLVLVALSVVKYAPVPPFFR